MGVGDSFVTPEVWKILKSSPPPRIGRTRDLFDLAVWIQRYFDTNGFEFSANYIIARAGGGYVTANNPIIPFAATDIFDNEFFTDKTVSARVNNSSFAPTTRDPIATVTGNVYHDEKDLRIKGRGGLDYLFTRTYNSGPTESADANGAPMGHGWSHSYNVRLIARDHGQEPNADVSENSDEVISSIVYVDERGGEHIYGVSGSGAASSWIITQPRGIFDELDLSEAASELYTLRFRNGTEYVFGGADLETINEVGRLVLIRDPYGNELEFGYDGGNLTSITDNLGIEGRELALSYDGAGRLETIEDWAGREWRYSYSVDGYLLDSSELSGAEGHAARS